MLVGFITSIPDSVHLLQWSISLTGDKININILYATSHRIYLPAYWPIINSNLIMQHKPTCQPEKEYASEENDFNFFNC